MGCVGCVTLGPPSVETSRAQTDRGFCNGKVISTHGAPKALHNGIYCDRLTTNCSELLLSQIPGESGCVPVGRIAVWHIQGPEFPPYSIPPAALGSLRG